MSASVKAAIVGGIFLLISTIIGIWPRNTPTVSVNGNNSGNIAAITAGRDVTVNQVHLQRPNQRDFYFLEMHRSQHNIYLNR
jgi:hypothetical protein